MAAPVASARQTPPGIKLKDGHSTLVTLQSDPNIDFWEKNITPPGLDGGEAVEQTTMHNAVWRTVRPRELVTLTEMTFTSGYDPVVYDQILAIINIETTITVWFSDGSSLAFYGFLRVFQPTDTVEGTQPEATVTITPTNFDPVNKVEAGPVLVEAAGT